jgi:hypothetical protein
MDSAFPNRYWTQDSTLLGNVCGFTLYLQANIQHVWKQSTTINIYVHQLRHLFISYREFSNLLKIHTKMLLHVSACDNHQGARI